MKMIDLYAQYPFKHRLGKKVMGYSGFQFICGEIVDREHRGELNFYKIESEYGKYFSGFLFEKNIKDYDEKLVLEEKRRKIGDDKIRVLTLRIVYDDYGTIFIVEENGEEVLREKIEGEDIDPESLMKSYEKLLTFLGYKPDLDRMFLGDELLVLNFLKDRLK